MEVLNHLLLGLSLAVTPENLLFCFIGVTLGTIVGVLPGLGPVAAISILIPFTLSISNPITGIIFLSGIYYGTQYGGSTTSILLNLPGEASSVVTAIDGYSMTKNGRAGAALAIAAMGSFFAGTVSTIIIAFLASPIANIAFYFGPVEYAALMFLGLLAVVSLSRDSFIKGLSMIMIGLLLSSIGFDVNSGTERLTFGFFDLGNGIPFAILIMSVFGLSEIIYNCLHPSTNSVNSTYVPTLKELYPSKEEFKRSIGPIYRGSIIGSILGVIPGAGPILASISSYSLEKKISKTPEKFGNGAVEGVAGPESANNAAAQTSFIPLLSLGIPTGPTMAIMLATLILFGLQPGPQLISSNSNLFWALIASMWIGNFFLLLLNLPLIKLWIGILKIPRFLLYSIIIIGCIFGAYTLTSNWFFVLLLIPLSILGYIFKILNCDTAPLVLSFVVGKMFEEYFRRSLEMSRGDLMVFFDKPISLSFMIVAALLIVFSIIYKKGKQ
jgi:TctA family transporter